MSVRFFDANRPQRPRDERRLFEPSLSWGETWGVESVEGTVALTVKAFVLPHEDPRGRIDSSHKTDARDVECTAIEHPRPNIERGDLLEPSRRSVVRREA